LAHPVKLQNIDDSEVQYNSTVHDTVAGNTLKKQTSDDAADERKETLKIK